MLTRRPPYNMEWVQALYKIGHGELPHIPHSLSEEARNFIRKCLQFNPEDRPSAAHLLKDPFVKRSDSAGSAQPSPMKTLMHRPPKDEVSSSSAAAAPTDAHARGDRKRELAKRRLHWLAVPVVILIIFAGDRLSAEPAWTPPVWVFHAGLLVMYSLLTGLSAWHLLVKAAK